MQDPYIEVAPMNDPDLSPKMLFHLWCHVPERGNPDPSGGTEYSLASGCPACGTGARQISPLRLNASDVKGDKPMAQTLCNWLLLHSSVVTILKRELDVAQDLIRVEDAKSGKALPYWQIRPAHVMPHMAPGSKGFRIDKQCRKCHRDGFFHDLDCDLALAYKSDRSTRSSLPPLSQSWECFGNSIREDRKEVVEGVTLSYVAGFAVPQVLARGDVCAVLRRFVKPAALTFHPVAMHVPKRS